MPAHPDFDAADARSLRLSAPALTLDTLDRFLAFQRRMAAVPLSADPAAVAAAHAEAIQESGLSPRQVGEIDAAARDFAGRRAVVQRLKQRIATADPELRARLEGELQARGDDAALERRYGRAVLDVLLAREEALLALHLQRAR